MIINWLKPVAMGTLFLFCACTEAQTENNDKPGEKPSHEELIEKNRELLQQERQRIDAFIEANGFDMQQTGSGMYYMQLSKSTLEKQVNISEGDRIAYDYRITLLDGTPVANSIDNGSRNITINKDQTAIGLHEAFLLMNVGDKMLFIVPSHLAYGISQNEDDVPPHATIIYELEPKEKLN
jgi:FKBP-type peptidyl-prolyl cis-trans isomerase